MSGFKLLKAYLRYIPSAAIDLLADVSAIILSPFIALPFFVYIDEKGREQLKSFLKWSYTHDASIDEFHMGSYYKNHRLLSRYSREQITASPLLSWFSRICWICRNPAYRVSHWLGYDQTGVDTTRGLYKDDRWDSGYPNRAYWQVENDSGQIGFLYQRQGYWFFGKLCLEMQFGWKLYRRDPDKRCMIAFRFNPFKRYKKKK